MMFKDLYLLRHGQASMEAPTDFDRPLTVDGVIQLRKLGRHLKHLGFYPHRLVSSPALRTRQTTEIIVEELDYSLPVHFDETIYEASVRTLFEKCLEADSNVTTQLLVGHNPGISYLYDYLTEENLSSLSPGELVAIRFEVSNWNEISKGMGRALTIGRK